MEKITSRKNARVQYIRNLSRDKAFRREEKMFVCAGEKLLGEAVAAGAEIDELFTVGEHFCPGVKCRKAYFVDSDLLSYFSPLENSPGPVFTVRMKSIPEKDAPARVLVLENLQDPGNVGTILRTSAALGIDMVVLAGTCADIYNPKTVRATMGAIFRQCVVEMTVCELQTSVKKWQMPLYGACLSKLSVDLRTVSMKKAAVAIGNEGNGLSRELLEVCDGHVIIPMTPGSESFNAAVAASIVMWEMVR